MMWVKRMDLDLNGYTDLPPGKIASVVTYLEMTSAPVRREAAEFRGMSLRRATVDLEEYRRVFRLVGQRWMWFSRLRLSDAQLRERLTDSATDVFYLIHDREAKGILELDRSQPPDIEIKLLGVAGELTGTGAGSFLMRHALEIAWKESPRRLWLHTCTLDHPAALAFYLKHGFKAYKRGIEVADDPRLAGFLPAEAASQVPAI